MSFCTEAEFEISPGLWTHNQTVAQIEADPKYGCCQKFVCGLPCPEKFNDRGVAVSFGVPVCVMAGFFITFGMIAGFFTVKKNDAKAFLVCKRSLPFWIATIALLAQGLDSNATLGAVTSAYKFGFWDGAVLPIGLGISLIINGLTLAGPINRMHVLSVPEIFQRAYGSLTEIVVSVIEVISFTCLLAGNLVGTSLIINFCFNLPVWAGIIIAGCLMVTYTMVGGLFSIALTDVPQAILGFMAFICAAIYVLVTDPHPAATPSMGFAIDLGGNVTAVTPGFKGPLDCAPGPDGSPTCDTFAYPEGDHAIWPNSMTSADAYAPFPNAILLNWATIIVLGLGNLCALDFQQRCMAAKSPKVARAANLTAGVLLLALCVPFTLMAGYVRRYYGPDSPSAQFAADTCSAPLGLPSCAQWVPLDRSAFFQFLYTKMNRFLGGWVMVAIMAASMSTATGAILATSTVMAHNVWRKIPKVGTSDNNLLLVARLFVVPMTVVACVVASVAYNPGYLLVVAFDVVFASCFVPLMFATYWGQRCSPNAGLLSVIAGGVTRVVLEFTLPKDGSLVAFGTYAKQFGPAIPGLPAFLEVQPPSAAATAGIWDPDKETCDQKPMSDWTGLDSLVSPVVCLLVFLTVHFIERGCGAERDILFFLPKSWRTPVGVMYPRPEDFTVYGDDHGVFGGGSGAPYVADKEGGGGLFDGAKNVDVPVAPITGTVKDAATVVAAPRPPV